MSVQGVSTFSRDGLSVAVEQLSDLLPALREALVADSGPQLFERVSGGGDEQELPFNADVAAALFELEHNLVAVVAYAAETVGEPGLVRNLEVSLNHAVRLHERLLVLGHAVGAELLVRDVRSALRAVRLALGLDMPDRAVQALCPLHDADLTQLVIPGRTGDLRWKDGRPVVVLQEETGIACRSCKAFWAPDQYASLQRMIDEAAERRALSNAC